MNVTLILLLVLLALAIWMLIRILRSDDSVAPKPGPHSVTQQTAFHAVSIKMSGPACQAAQDIAGRRFLSTEAPKLPLAECDRDDCSCRFVHHQDRRSGKDRRSPFGPGGLGGGSGMYDREQRDGKDRRAPPRDR